MPEKTTTKTDAPTRTEPDTRPRVDPDTVREPDRICPQQRREQGWEAF